MGYRSERYEAYQCLKGLAVYPFQLVGLATWVLVTPRPWSLYLWTLPTFSQRISHQLGGAMSKPSCWGSRWRHEKGRITDHQKHFLFSYKKYQKVKNDVNRAEWRHRVFSTFATTFSLANKTIEYSLLGSVQSPEFLLLRLTAGLRMVAVWVPLILCATIMGRPAKKGNIRVILADTHTDTIMHVLYLRDWRPLKEF